MDGSSSSTSTRRSQRCASSPTPPRRFRSRRRRRHRCRTPGSLASRSRLHHHSPTRPCFPNWILHRLSQARSGPCLPLPPTASSTSHLRRASDPWTPSPTAAPRPGTARRPRSQHCTKITSMCPSLICHDPCFVLCPLLLFVMRFYSWSIICLSCHRFSSRTLLCCVVVLIWAHRCLSPPECTSGPQGPSNSNTTRTARALDGLVARSLALREGSRAGDGPSLWPPWPQTRLRLAVAAPPLPSPLATNAPAIGRCSFLFPATPRSLLRRHQC